MTTYRESGVDIDAGEETIRRIKPLVRGTFTPGVLTDIGAFGAFYQPDFSRYIEPVLVSSVDGVGTKLKVAFAAGRHDTIGQDLVNHCVNDIAVCGAEPLYFMDYYSTGRLDPAVAEEVVRGFSIACSENGCALIGGETAEMPGLYSDGEFDLAGMIVGVVDRPEIVDGRNVEQGDVLVGLPSTGLHTNGFSLARSVLLERFSIDDTPAELGGESLGDTLLTVHRSYLQSIRTLLASEVDVHAMVHVTGGGIPGNTQRVIPKHLDFEIDYSTWERPAIFNLIQEEGSVPEMDLRRTFNLGIGIIFVIPSDQSSAAVGILEQQGESPVLMGIVK
jgi:phosphoribosylformylglycinamidine cyclo-ligase